MLEEMLGKKIANARHHMTPRAWYLWSHEEPFVVQVVWASCTKGVMGFNNDVMGFSKDVVA